jgi:hypothetical protein
MTAPQEQPLDPLSRLADTQAQTPRRTRRRSTGPSPEKLAACRRNLERAHQAYRNRFAHTRCIPR